MRAGIALFIQEIESFREPVSRGRARRPSVFSGSHRAEPRVTPGISRGVNRRIGNSRPGGRLRPEASATHVA
jgi:hypothetical protein